jgi:hypothetical protein
MQKVFSLLFVLLLASSFALAQQASHDVLVRIPNVLMLRITDGNGNNAASNPGVTFDFVSDPDTYISAVNSGDGELSPTSISNFSDVIVFSNRASWTVNVQASAISASQLSGLNTGLSGMSLAKIGVAPSTFTPTAFVTSRAESWTLSENATAIAQGTRTQGWRSLGFSGSDYRLTVDGSEDPGQYATTVTYTIAAP